MDRAQALDQLQDGILKHSGGIIEIAVPDQDFLSSDLPYKNLLIGDSDNKAKPRSTIYLDNLPDLQAITLQIGQITYGIWEMWQGTNLGRPAASYNVSTTLAQIDFAFKSTNWIIGKSGVVPGAISYPAAQFIDQLPAERILTHVSDGQIGVASLTHNYFWVGDENKIPVERNTLPAGSLPDLQFKHLWIGDDMNRPQENLLILMDNLPNLTFKAIWRGNTGGRPEETQDLTILEGKVTFIENVKIPAIEAEIASIQGEITAIQGQITVIEGEVALLEGAVVVLQGQVAGLLLSVAELSSRVSTLESKVSTLETSVATLQAQILVIQGQIASINARIDALSITLTGDVTGSGLLASPVVTELQLTLDQIKKAQNSVDLNNHKIINLVSGDVEPLDALNAQFLWDLMHDNVEVVWQ